MRGQHHRRALPQAVGQQLEHTATGLGIQVPRGFIREDHLRIRHERTRESDPLPFPAGEHLRTL